MIISHSRKFIFIKSFKTAGTSVESVLSNFCEGDDIVTPINDFRHNRNENGEFIHKSMNADEFIKLDLPNLQHVEASVIKNMLAPDIWSNYYKFSIARNPWDRVVSYFYWEMRSNPAIKPRKRFYNYLGIPFNELDQIKKLFSKFVKSENWPSNDSFYTIDDHLCVDFVIRYEKLSEDFDEVCKIIQLPTESLPRLKGGIRTQRYHYSDYYNEESKEIVAKKHHNDINLFGYKFESK